MSLPRQLRWGWTYSVSVALRIRSRGLATFEEQRYWTGYRWRPRFVLTPTALGRKAISDATNLQ